MKITQFDAPVDNGDFTGNPALAAKWSAHMSKNFDDGVGDVPLAEPLKGDDGVSRGLHFLCYQASIADQFEKLQQDWANNTGAPTSGGHDLIIGQTKTATRTIDLPPLVPGQLGETVTAPKQWVTPTDGGYLFAPSISAIRDMLAPGAAVT